MSALVGVNLSTSAAPGWDPVTFARRAEALGFDFVSATDHPNGRHASYETWTLLTWVAAHTSRIGIATRVLAVPTRPPALVAKMAESLDRLSGGRLVLGLGGGGSDDELRALGVGAWSAADKVTGLEEAIRITRGLWTGPAFSFSGRFHGTDRAELEPKPARPIPIWLGTFGPRALAVTGRLADGWIPSVSHAPPDRLPEMRERVLDAAVDAGRDPSDLTFVLNVDVHVSDRPEAGAASVTGAPAAVAEQLHELMAIGFHGLNLVTAGDGTDDQFERLAQDVVPALRAANAGVSGASIR